MANETNLFTSLNTFFKRATDVLDSRNNKNIDLGSKEFIKANSPENVIKTSVEDGAYQFFRNQQKKIVKGKDNRQLTYEASRIMLYYDYLNMDGYPTLGAALDLLAEESTTKGETGQILNIYSSSNKVKKTLEDLFFNVIDVNTNLYQICRDMCQFGDKFLYLEFAKNKGIIDFRALAYQYTERVEKYDEKERFRAYFKYKDPYGGSNEEYLDYQVAHFRLLGSGDRLPYGSSVFEKVRRTFKQLFMMEDAMMVYRITRAAERRVYRIPVGNIPPEDVNQVLEAFANNIKRKHLVDPQTGDINFKYNIASMDEDIFIPDRDKTTGNLIDTLPGASNLDSINDITYLRDNLFVGLGIHKTLLGFSSDSASGDGKNLSMLDIRFARKVNRIQQALIGELNKIAIIHLGLLGGDYQSYIDDFTLSLNNPSTASDLLLLEIWKSKMEVYNMATTPNNVTNIKPMSELMGKKKFFNMSEQDIMDDLQEQMLESKIGEEIKGAGMLLKSSGIMDKMIRYKNAGFSLEQQPTDQQQGMDAQGMDMGGMPPMGDGMGGMMPPSGNLSGPEVNTQGGNQGTSTQPPASMGASGFLGEGLINKVNDLKKTVNE